MRGRSCEPALTGAFRACVFLSPRLRIMRCGIPWPTPIAPQPCSSSPTAPASPPRPSATASAQFERRFNHVTLPFIDTADKAQECLARDRRASARTARSRSSSHAGQPGRARRRAPAPNGLVLDMFHTFIEPLEAELGIKSNHPIGRSHIAMDKKEYQTASRRSISRWRTTTARRRDLGQADVILVGVAAAARRRPPCTWRCSTASRRPTTR